MRELQKTSTVSTNMQVSKRRVHTKLSSPSPETLPTPLNSSHRLLEAEKKPYTHAIYYLTEEPPVILPSAPTDQEKYSYISTDPWGILPSRIIAVLCSLANALLIDRFHKIFVTFAVYNAVLTIVTSILDFMARDLDLVAHQNLLDAYPVGERDVPTMDIFLPVCREPLEVIENTWRHVAKLDYPEDKLKVYVLDDGAMDEVREMSKKYGFEYVVRDDRPRMKKGGNLRWAFARTKGRFFTGTWSTTSPP